MDEETVKQAAMHALIIEAKAIETEIEGMKIANIERIIKGEALAYDNSSFIEVSAKLRLISLRLLEEI